MSLVASSKLCKLFKDGDAAKERVGLICNKSSFLSHVESMRDVYEVSSIKDGDHVVIFRSFKPMASFVEMFSPQWERKKGKADADALLLRLAVALEAFHNRGIAHGSLSPDCVVVDEKGGVHLCAVGFYAFEDITATISVHDDIAFLYVAPEAISGESVDWKACDVFSFGCVVYYALTGHHAFASENAYMSFKRVAADVAMPEGVPAKYKRLMEWCWRKQEERPSMREVADYLKE